MKYTKLFIFILLVFVVQACAFPTAPSNEAPDQFPTAQVVTGNQPSSDSQPVVQEPTTVQPVEVTATANAIFDANNSGSICPKRSPELALGSAPPIIGEIDDTYRCEGYWTFALPQLPPDAKILSATFTPGACSVVGTPFAYDSLYFGYADVAKIEVSDYGNGAESVLGEYKECPASIDVTRYFKAELQLTRLQILAAFDMSDYGNGTGDYISYEQSMPTLTIEYRYTQ